MKQNILIRTKVRKAEALLRENRLTEAKQLCEQIFQANRADPEALVLLGTINRRLGNHAEAESHCRKALQLNPNLPEAHQALGAALQCQGMIQQAVDCYQTAIHLKPDLIEAHYLLGNVLREHGQLEKAAEYYRKVLQLDPEHVPSLCNLGGTLAGLYQYDEAAVHLNKANRLRPGSVPVLCNIARILLQLGRSTESEARCKEALQHDPQAVDAMVMLAELLEKSSRLDETHELIERGLKLAPSHPGMLLISAKLARREGRHQDAVVIAEAALSENPPADKKNELHHLLGQLYDRQGDTVRAFAHFTEGNRVTASAVSDAKRHSYMRSIDEHRKQFRAALPLAADTAAQTIALGEKSPVFLVGFPRSGTTLLEQILDSHPQLQALDERPTVGVMLQTHERIVARRREAATALTSAELEELRNAYFGEASKHLKREPGRTLVDKFPLNLINAYHIWRVFPDAKFILAIRHPCDVCLSCFMQNFALNEAMIVFTNLEDTAYTYASVMNLWQEFTQGLPLRYHMIRYEDLVENMEDEARRLLKFLDIEWSDAVLDHVEHARHRGVIRTPSYHQVTQPIYKTAKYRWKRYAKELEPIMETLRPFIERFGYHEAD
jgi:tetratricopeptide (TPR) repeat protein